MNTAYLAHLKNLVTNFSAISFLEIVNILTPLIVYPYLFNVIEIEYMGILAVAGAVSGFSGLVMEFSFNLYASRYVTIMRANKNKLQELISLIATSQVYLIILSAFLITLLSSAVPYFKDIQLEICLFFVASIGAALIPKWFYLGIENMKPLLIMKAIGSILYCTGIIFFINEQEKYYLVPIILLLTNFIAAITLWFEIALIRKILPSHTSFKNVKIFLIQGLPLFVPTFFNSLYANTTIVLLGALTSSEVVGGYSIIIKLYNITKALVNSINLAMQPVVNKNIKDIFNKKFIYFIISKIVLVTSFIVVSNIFFIAYGDKIVMLLFPDLPEMYIHCLYILLSSVAFIYLSQVLGRFFLINFDKNKLFWVSVAIPTLTGLIFSPLAIYNYGALGLALLTALIELVIFLIRSISLIKIIRHDTTGSNERGLLK